VALLVYTQGLAFVQATMHFLDAKLKGDSVQQGGGDGQLLAQPVGKINLSLETLAIFLRVLQEKASHVPQELAMVLKQLQAQVRHVGILRLAAG
jgi:hypothetical protein